MKILVTGASGFIGSFIVEKGLTEGHVIWQACAPPVPELSSDSRIRFVELDMEHPEILRPQLAACKAEFGGWDVIVHAAGATKCIRREDFFRTNTEGTRHFVDALRELDMVPGRFIFISSLSVFGAIREQAVRHATSDNPRIYAPIRENDTPRPNTAYGESKLEAERYLKSLKDFPYVILRPTGVYGPREKELLRHGAKYQTARRLQRRIPSAGNHIRLRERPCTSRFLCHGKRCHRARIFHQRRKRIPQYGIQRLDTHGAWTSVHAPHQGSGMVPSFRMCHKWQLQHMAGPHHHP